MQVENRGSSTTLVMATAHTISSTSARTGWHVLSAAFIWRRDPPVRSCSKARRICYACGRKFRSTRRSWRRWTMGWRHCRSSSTNWRMLPLLPGRPRANCRRPNSFILAAPSPRRAQPHDTCLGQLSGGEGGRLHGDGARQLWLTAPQTRPRLPSRALPTASAYFKKQSRELHRQYRQECLGLPFRLVHYGTGRSEERRVGKEGRSRWWPYHETK